MRKNKVIGLALLLLVFGVVIGLVVDKSNYCQASDELMPIIHTASASWNPDDCYEDDESTFSVQVSNNATELFLQILGIDINWWWQRENMAEYIAEVEHLDSSSPGWRVSRVAPGQTKTIFSRVDRVSGVGRWRGEIVIRTDQRNPHTIAHLVIRASEVGPQSQPGPQSGPGPAVEPVEADLELIPGTLEFSAPSFTVGQEIKIAAKVKNTGTKKLSPVEVEFWVNDKRIGEDKVGALNPGDKKRFIIYWTPADAGQYNIHAVVDPRRRFNERDEGNNRDDRTITITR